MTTNINSVDYFKPSKDPFWKTKSEKEITENSSSHFIEYLQILLKGECHTPNDFAKISVFCFKSSKYKKFLKTSNKKGIYSIGSLKFKKINYVFCTGDSQFLDIFELFENKKIISKNIKRDLIVRICKVSSIEWI
jgi:hypothetical protein